MRCPRRAFVPAISFLTLAIAFLPGLAGAETSAQRALAVVNRQPLRFETVEGGFAARASGFAMTLRRGSAVVSRRGAPAVRMAWPGSSGAVQPVAGEPAAGRTNYLIGSDPTRWRRGVRSFGRVRYPDLYPGIDLVFYGNQEQLEYDFVVAAGADPQQIRLRFSGESALRIDGRGNLVIGTGSDEIVQRAPVVYQEHDGKRRAVAGRYVRTGRHEVAFTVADYDRGSALYIDPVLTFSSFFGASGTTIARAVTVDANGNAYVTGYTNTTTDFPTTPGVLQRTCPTCAYNKDDVFVTKISQTGVLVYSTYVGGADYTDDKGYAIAVDTAGNAYVTGESYYPGSGATFPVVGGFTTAFGGGAFLFKLDSTGSSILYSTQIRSGSSCVGYGVAVQGSNAYVAGMAVADGTFPRWPTAGTYSTLIGSAGTYQAFILKIDTAAVGDASRVYATRFGGSDSNYAYAVAVSSAGEAYVTGETTSANFPITNGAAQSTCGTAPNCNNRVEDAFVSKFNAAGSALLYSTFAGGGNTDTGYGVAIDGSGNAYVAGVTYSPDFPVTAGAFDETCGNLGLCESSNDAFALKVSPNGSSFSYSTFLGGGASDAARAITVDGFGDAYVAGFTTSIDFPHTADAIQPNRNGTNTDAFVTVLNPTGTALAYSSYLGGSAGVSGGDEAFGIDLDSAGDAWVVGQTDSADFPAKPGAIATTHGSALFDGFVVKIGDPLSLTAAMPASGGTSGGPTVRLTGTGFMAGAAVTFGGVAATGVTVVSPTTILAVTPPHAAGGVNLVVTSLDGQSATLTGGFTYVADLTFTNDPLQAGVTPVRAVHVNELRTAVSTLLSRYGLPPVTWTDGVLTAGDTVKAAHVTQLRTALEDVYTAAGATVPTWTPATIIGGSTVITAAQITQLRAATLGIW